MSMYSIFGFFPNALNVALARSFQLRASPVPQLNRPSMFDLSKVKCSVTSTASRTSPCVSASTWARSSKARFLSPLIRRLQASISAGSYTTYNAGFKALGPAGPVGYVVAVNHFDTHGYRQHSSATRDIVNAKLVFAPEVDTRVTMIGNIQKTS